MDPRPRRWCLALLALLGVLLGARGLHRSSWSDWAFGDSQTLETLRYWHEDGPLRHHALFVPYGYTRELHRLDEPALRQHAHGINPGSSPGVGPRLYYTHYPSGYLWPYYALYTLGVREPRVFGAFSILMSLAGLWLWFKVFTRLTDPWTALAATTCYGGANAFLAFSTSLSNLPLDDLLRAAFLLLLLRGGKRDLVAAWAAALVLCLCSLDSPLFIGVCLLGHDLLILRRARWMLWLAFLLAPVLAFGTQFAQNAWYLGAAEAWRDVQVTFLRQSPTGGETPGRAVLLALSRALPLPGGGPAAAAWVAVLALLLGRRLPWRGVLLLGMAGLAYLVVLPRAGQMPYQGRQLLPLAALLVGTAAVSGRTLLPHARGIALLLLALGAWGCELVKTGTRFWRQIDYIETHASFAQARALGTLEGERIYFHLDVFAPPILGNYLPGYPQVHPTVEYLSGGLVLNFENADLLVRDLKALWTPGSRFRPILLAAGPLSADRIRTALQAHFPGCPDVPLPPIPLDLPGPPIAYDLAGALPPREAP